MAGDARCARDAPGEKSKEKGLATTDYGPQRHGMILITDGTDYTDWEIRRSNKVEVFILNLIRLIRGQELVLG